MKTGNPYLFLVKAVLSYCLVLLPGIFLWAQPTDAPTNTHALQQLHHNGPCWCAAYNHRHNHQPGTSFFVLEWIAEETEAVEDGETDDFSSFEWNALLPFSLLQTATNAVPQTTLFVELTRAIHSRPAVSLFVLHHSWKSFLV